MKTHGGTHQRHDAPSGIKQVVNNAQFLASINLAGVVLKVRYRNAGAAQALFRSNAIIGGQLGQDTGAADTSLFGPG